MIRARAAGALPPSCRRCSRVLVLCELTDGSRIRRCRGCSSARLVDAGYSVEGEPVFVAQPAPRAPGAPPPCPRCSEPLGLLDAGCCACCGYPGAPAGASREGRHAAAARRRLDARRSAS